MFLTAIVMMKNRRASKSTSTLGLLLWDLKLFFMQLTVIKAQKPELLFF